MAIIEIDRADNLEITTSLEIQRPGQVIAVSAYTRVPQIYNRNHGTWQGAITFRPFSGVFDQELNGKLDALLAQLRYAENVLKMQSNLWVGTETFTGKRQGATRDYLLNSLSTELKPGMHLSRAYAPPLMPRLVRVVSVEKNQAETQSVISVEPDHVAANNAIITFNLGDIVWLRLSSDIPRPNRTGDFIEQRIIEVEEAIKDIS